MSVRICVTLKDYSRETRIDSRDLEKRRCELVDTHETWIEWKKGYGEMDPEDPNYEEPPEKLTEAEREELRKLDSLADETPEWKYGALFILAEDFEDYARELADDIGVYSQKVQFSWPLNCIDWKKAAGHLAQDYMDVDIYGVTFKVRRY